MKAFAAICAAVVLGALAPGAFAAGSDDKSEAIQGNPDYIAGRKAVEEKRWSDAIPSLEKAARMDPDNPDLQNWLGYSHRNLKQYDLAFKHYNRALELDPRHRAAREYLGEAYLIVGDLAGAEKQLAALKDICLLPCEEEEDLEKAIADYKKTPK
jgi:Flp pilus assembly protein TadD